jgi:putative redox protein
MEAIIRYLGGVRFESESRGHKVLTDQPVENGGEDAGMTPPELLLASLGTCAGFYAAQYLRVHKLPVDGLTVRVQAQKDSQPARLGSFHIEIECPAAEAPKHQEGLLRAAKKCLIHNTLTIPPSIDIAVHAPQIEEAIAG